MTCAACDQPSTIEIEHHTLCAGHGKGMITAILCGGYTPDTYVTAIRNGDTVVLNDELAPAPVIAPVVNERSPMMRHGWAAKPLPVDGAHEQPPPRLPRNSKNWVTAFVHKATDPRRTWPGH